MTPKHCFDPSKGSQDEKKLSHDDRVQIARYNEVSISTAAAAINITIAALLVIGPTIGLIFVGDNKAKPWMIGASLQPLPSVVGTMINVKRAEIFAPTAAYVYRALPPSLFRAVGNSGPKYDCSQSPLRGLGGQVLAALSSC